MAAVEVRRLVPTPLERVWDSLTDFAEYGRWLPLTSMRVDEPPLRVGRGFAGRTGVGPLAFLDSMLVVRWEPPQDGVARFAVRKTGRVLGGWADVRLQEVQGGTEVVWQEEIVPRPEPLGRLAAPLVDALTGRLFGRALDRMLAADSPDDVVGTGA